MPLAWILATPWLTSPMRADFSCVPPLLPGAGTSPPPGSQAAACLPIDQVGGLVGDGLAIPIEQVRSAPAAYSPSLAFFSCFGE